MAKDTSKSGAADPAGRRKPPIIDLSAAEVRKADAAQGNSPARAAEDPSVPGVRQGSARNGQPDPLSRPSAKARVEEPVIPSALATAAPGRRGNAEPARGGWPFPALLLAAIGGGLLAALVVLVLGRILAPPQQASVPDLTADVAALRSDLAALSQAGADDLPTELQSQIAALQQAIEELRSGPAADAADPAVPEEIESRLAGLEERVEQGVSAGSDPALNERLTELEGLVVALQDRIEALRGQVVELGSTVDATSADLETALALGPAVAADALAESLQSGMPFVSELNALRGLGFDEAALAGLEPHAEAGLPTLAELGAGFEAAAEGIELRPPLPEETGTLDRLLQSARGLVEVRPANPVAGTEPAAIVARIRGALDAGDLAAALAEWNALPGDAKAKTGDWARAAEARHAADALVARLRAQALSRLGEQG